MPVRELHTRPHRLCGNGRLRRGRAVSLFVSAIVMHTSFRGPPREMASSTVFNGCFFSLTSSGTENLTECFIGLSGLSQGWMGTSTSHSDSGWSASMPFIRSVHINDIGEAGPRL